MVCGPTSFPRYRYLANTGVGDRSRPGLRVPRFSLLCTGGRGDDVVVHPHRVSRPVELVRVLRKGVLPYVRMYSLLAAALLRSAVG